MSGASAGKTQALALEPSGGFSTHIAGARAGMTHAVTWLGQSTKAPTHGFPCGLSLSCMTLGSEAACPGSGLCRRTKRKLPGLLPSGFQSHRITSAVFYQPRQPALPLNSREEGPSCHAWKGINDFASSTCWVGQA